MREEVYVAHMRDEVPCLCSHFRVARRLVSSLFIGSYMYQGFESRVATLFELASPYNNLVTDETPSSCKWWHSNYCNEVLWILFRDLLGTLRSKIRMERGRGFSKMYVSFNAGIVFVSKFYVISACLLVFYQFPFLFA